MTKKYCTIENVDYHYNYLNRYQDFYKKLLSNLNQSVNQVEGFNHTDFKFDIYYTYAEIEGKLRMPGFMSLYNDYICFASIDNDNLANYNYHQLMQIYQWQPIAKWRYEYDIDRQWLELTSNLSTDNCIRVKLEKDLNQFKESDLKAIVALINKIYNLFFVNNKLQKNQLNKSLIKPSIAFNDINEFEITLDLKNFGNSTIYLTNGAWINRDEFDGLVKDALTSDSPVAKFLNNYKNFKHWLNSNSNNNKISL